MTKENAIKKTKRMCIIFTIIGIIMLFVAFYKITAYENPEYSWETNVNSYVGGDAYNYIINGTYFTGYAVMGTGSLIIASIMGGINICLSVQSDKETYTIEKLPEI